MRLLAEFKIRKEIRAMSAAMISVSVREMRREDWLLSSFMIMRGLLDAALWVAQRWVVNSGCFPWNAGRM